MVHGPKLYGGYEVSDLWVAQAALHFMFLAKCSHYTNSIQSKLIRTSAELLKLELGLNGPLFSHKAKDWQDIATISWIKNKWQFGDSNNITMVDDIQDFPLRRLYDKTIMDTFFEAGFRKGDLQALNRSRLYLKVITIAEVVTGCGERLASQRGLERSINRGHRCTDGQNKDDHTGQIGGFGGTP